MTINSASFAKALWPGINKWYGAAYATYDDEWKQVFTTDKSTKAFEEEVGMTGLGLFQVKTEGANVTYEDMSQGFISRYQHVVYALGFIITREMYEDNQYAEIGLRKSKQLAFSNKVTKNTVGINVLNRAFNNSYTGGDGLELCSDAHLNKSGGTWRNELATSADLSPAALEQACIDISMEFKTDKGLPIKILPQKLLVHPNNEFEAIRILKSVNESGTADNDINAIRVSGKLPKGYSAIHYLDDADAWFILTNCPDGLKHFERRGDEFGVDNDFDTENAKFKASGRYSFGWTDPRGIFGSPGA